MQPLTQYTDYTEEQVIDMLHAKKSPRVLRFRYDVLNSDYDKINELNKVVSCTVSMSAFARIKRTASMTLIDETIPARRVLIGGVEQTIPATPKIDFLRDLIQPFAIFQMPDGGEIAYPLGVFFASAPTKTIADEGLVREVDLFDGLIVLDENIIGHNIYFPAGMNYMTAIKEILNNGGVYRTNLTATTATLQRDREFEIGTSRLDIVNALLEEINYTPLWCDANGYYTATPYLAPGDRSVEYSYLDDDLSVTSYEMEEELDLYKIANRWVLVQTNPEGPPLSYTMQNDNYASPTSTVSRGRVITDYREVNDIASYAALQALTQRIAFESSQVFGKIKFETAIMPFHEYHNLLYIRHRKLGVADNFTETSWEIECEPGARMKHEARKVVFL